MCCLINVPLLKLLNDLFERFTSKKSWIWWWRWWIWLWFQFLEENNKPSFIVTDFYLSLMCILLRVLASKWSFNQIGKQSIRFPRIFSTFFRFSLWLYLLTIARYWLHLFNYSFFDSLFVSNLVPSHQLLFSFFDYSSYSSYSSSPSSSSPSSSSPLSLNCSCMCTGSHNQCDTC